MATSYAASRVSPHASTCPTSAPYLPDLLLVALHEVAMGRNSPADWHRAARESEPAYWLALGCVPARSRGYAFRDRLGLTCPPWSANS